MCVSANAVGQGHSAGIFPSAPGVHAPPQFGGLPAGDSAAVPTHSVAWQKFILVVLLVLMPELSGSSTHSHRWGQEHSVRKSGRLQRYSLSSRLKQLGELQNSSFCESIRITLLVHTPPSAVLCRHMEWSVLLLVCLAK